MAFTGIVTKVGVMNKTATVTVPRFVIHKRTGKVCGTTCVHDNDYRWNSIFPASGTEHQDINTRREQRCVSHVGFSD
jgi:hypothetical protein